MKMIYSALLIFIINSVIYSQIASLRTQNVFSQNQKYEVQIKGNYYEGFAGNQEISLINTNKDTLWKEIVPRRFLILPSVSNIGDVAITHREIKIFDKNKKLKGTFALKKKESPYHTGDYEGTVHGFSLEGDKYLIFLYSAPEVRGVSLLCLSDSAKEVWKLDLGYYMPSEIFFYKDKVVTHDFGVAARDYINCCYVFDLNGNILWKYDTDSRNPSDWDVSLNKNGILTINGKSKEIRTKLDTLSYKNNAFINYSP